jgi:cyclic pyranopterin phosphate synthase
MAQAVPEPLARRRSLPVAAPPRPEAAVVATGPRSVRLSVTDRCDFACTYCRPSRDDGYVETRLDLAAWSTMIDGLVAAGVRRFRLTGGEPLVHPKIVELVRAIAERGVSDLALTTNASQLARLARPLREAGLDRLNVSIDTLDEGRFARITRGGRLRDVLAGLEAARAAGFSSIKLNTVVLRGENDGELERLVDFAWGARMVPRFLEVMPIAEGAKLAATSLVTVREMRDRLAHRTIDDADFSVEPDRGPARYLPSREDPDLRVGFISGTSDTYCATCDRLRVSSTGVLRPCLATDDGVDAGDAAKAGEAGEVPRRIEAAWRMKPDGRVFRGCTEPSAAKVSMRAIGG